MMGDGDPEQVSDSRQETAFARLPVLSPQRWAGLLASAAETVLGRRPPSRVPAEVHAVIAADQRSSEILVCIVQFAAIVFFGAFYTLTPKAFPAEVPFEPVPLALCTYAMFTGVRLWLAISGRLTPVFLSLFGRCRCRRADADDLELPPPVPAARDRLPEGADAPLRLHPDRAPGNAV